MTEDDGGTEPRDSLRGLGLLCLLAAVAGVGVGFCRRRVPLVSDQGRRTSSGDRELGASRSVRRVASCRSSWWPCARYLPY